MRALIASSLYILLILIVSHTNASPTEIRNFQDSLTPAHVQLSSLPPPIQNRHKDHELEPAAALSRRKRGTWLTDLGRGWVGHIETFESFMPAQIAAATLISFYRSAYNHVQSIRIGRTPENYYACELDNLMLEFYSADMPIPWDFVTTFMAKMAIKVSRGFTGKFTYLYVHMPTGRGMRVSLDIVNVAGAT